MIIQPSNRANSVSEYFFSQKLREIRQMQNEGKEILNLGIGSPDLPPSAEVVNTLISEVQKPDNHGYQSYMGVPELRKAFAHWYKKWFEVSLNPDSEILPLIGSKEGIMHISMAFLNSGDKVLIPDPSYPTYESVSKIVGAEIIKYNLHEHLNWQPDFSEIEKNDLSQVKIMWINYPNMPTGASADLEFFKKLIAFAKKYKILIVNDNPYNFILNTNYLSILQIEGAKDVALELNSVSKAHNMAGWRVGAVFGKQEYLQTILKIKSNMDSGMFLPVQLATAKALYAEKDWYTGINKIYAERKKYVYEILDTLKCEYNTNFGGMFVWAKIPEKFKNSFEMSDEILYKAGVFVTPGGIFGKNGEKYIRISLCANIKTLKKAKEKIERKL